jgi:AbrB family looped-hinge helix DNA binding protein
MFKEFSEESIPKFYGATTIGERGQIVIPAEARKDLNMSSSTKLMVFSAPMGEGLMLVKADSITKFLTHASKMLSGFEEIVKSNKTEPQ